MSSAILLTVSFPPFRSVEGAWGALVPLLFLARFTDPIPAFGWGLLSGLLFWLATLHWLWRLAVTGTSWSLAGLGWLILSGCCAVYHAAFTLTASAAMRDLREADARPEDGRCGWGTTLADVARVFGLPMLWVGFEYWRSVLFTGFPWNHLGVTQFRNVPVIQLAEWGGVYAVSALVALVNTVAFTIVLRAVEVVCRRRVSRVPLATVAGLGALLWGVRQSHQLGGRERIRPAQEVEVRLAAVQPNVEQRKKWKPGSERETYARLEAQTELVLSFRRDLDLILWPETALPTAFNEDDEARAFVCGLARDQVPLLVGALETAAPRHRKGAPPSLYNVSLLLDRSGEVAAVYRKQHLVPFGEYLPFERWFPWLQRFAPLGFSCTPGTTGTVMRLALRRGDGGEEPASCGGQRRTPEVPFSVLICFEDAFPGLARAAVRHGARFLVVQTNDAWFDPWAGSLQHLAQGVFRAVENRIPIARVGNTGITAFLDRMGRIENVDLLEANNWDRCVEGYKVSSLRVETEGHRETIYTRWGDRAFALPCALGSLITLVLAGYHEGRRGALRLRRK